MEAAKFTVPAARKIVDATRQVLAQGSDNAGTARPRNQAYTRTFWGKLTSATAFTEVYPTIVSSVLTWTNVPSGLTGTLKTPCNTGGVVLIRQDFDNTTATTPVAIYQAIEKLPVVVVLGSVISGAGGKYNGTIYGGTASDSGTGNLSLPDGLSAGASCLVVNQDEQGQPTHWAIVGSSYNYAVGTYLGMSSEGTPRPIILIARRSTESAARRRSQAQPGRPIHRPGTARWKPAGRTTGTCRQR